MTKPYHNLRVSIYILLYIVVNLVFYPLGKLIHDIPFAFGMTQLTIFTALICVKYDLFAEEVAKMKKQPLMHLILFLVCCVLFSIVAMSAYLKVLGTNLLISIEPENLNLGMLVAQLFMILFIFPLNDAFFIKLMRSLDYKQSEQNRLMIGLATYVLLRSVLFYLVNPASLVIAIGYTLITGFGAVMLLYKNMSLMMYPLAVLAIGTLFVFI